MEHYFTNNENIKSELKYLSYIYNDTKFTFISDNGVFSKSSIDYGSKLLVETILKTELKPTKILDLGCGYGFIGIVLGHMYNASVDFVDVNNRAISLCEKNIKTNMVNGSTFVSDAYDKITDKYDLIVTNPPIRAGKVKVLEMLKGAVNHLSENGQLLFVIRKEQGAKSIIKIISAIYECQILEKSKGFYIICAKLS